MTTKKIFGKNVKYFRYKLGITQEQLAEQIESNSTYVSDIENGKYNVSFDKIDLIANALGIEVVELFVNRKELFDMPWRVDISNKMKEKELQEQK